MPDVYQAHNVVDAIRIANEFREKGTYDWFRGQLEDWPLKSSFTRLNGEQQQVALKQAERFISWAQATPGLEALVQDVDATCAVAQHYGIPSNYIDFTLSPEIAGFFAADNPFNRPLERQSCILCLNTANLKQFWQHMPSDWPTPELIEIQVPNLWRIEAQQGRFLFCGAENFEEIYDLDRIVFPYTGPLKVLPRDRIYPVEKSSLEILLDQFFMTERLAAGTAVVRKLPWGKRIRFEDTGDANAELVIGEVPRLPSWGSDLRRWVDHPVESYEHVSGGPTIRFEAAVEEEPPEAGSRLKSIVRAHLDGEVGTRTSSLSWSIDGETIPLERRRRLVHALQWLWDGMRILPYTTDQLADCAGQCVALWQAGADNSDRQTMSAASNRCFGSSIEVEFGAADGAYAKAFVSERTLLRAVRPDIAHYLNPQFRAVICASASGLLMAVRDPSRLFDFPPLADAFARELVPCQVLYRQGANAVFFSPARLHRFGLP